VAARTDYTVAYRSADGRVVDLCKIILSADGSYYLTAPYHNLNRAIAAKLTVNYATDTIGSALNDAVEVATLEDDERRLKLSHHPDGFLQFSGEGILSGRNADGTPKGIGTQSWSLLRPTFGPSFGIAFSDPLATGRTTAGRRRTVVFDEADIAHMRTPAIRGLIFVGYYLPVPWREYAYLVGPEQYEIQIVNPSAQAVLRLTALLASPTSAYPGLIGIQALPHGLPSKSNVPSFMMMSSTGDLRRNKRGELLGDQLICVYPQPDLDAGSSYMSLNYPLPAPAYVAPVPWYDVIARLRRLVSQGRP